MNNKQIISFIKKIEKQEQSLSNERDKIIELIDELKDLEEISDRALESLRDAKYALSELV